MMITGKSIAAAILVRKSKGERKIVDSNRNAVAIRIFLFFFPLLSGYPKSWMSRGKGRGRDVRNLGVDVGSS